MGGPFFMMLPSTILHHYTTELTNVLQSTPWIVATGNLVSAVSFARELR